MSFGPWWDGVSGRDRSQRTLLIENTLLANSA